MRALFALALALLSTTTAALAQEPVGVEPADPADTTEPADAPDAPFPASQPAVAFEPPRIEAPADPADEAPLVEAPADPVDVAPELPRLELQGCRDLVRRQDLPAARVCYGERGPGDDERTIRLRQRVAAALVDVSAPAPASPGLQQLGELFTSGKAELLATGTGFGGYLATLAVLDAGFLLFQLLQVQVPWELQPLGPAIVLLSPIAGGAVGLALGALVYAAWPGMTAGDANLLRSSLWLGAFNSGVLGILTQGYGARTILNWWQLTGTAVTTSMIAGAVGTVGAGAVLALLTDLPEGAGPLGLSLGLWSGTLAVLGQLMFDLPLRFEDGTLLVGAVANAGFATGLLLSPFVPMTRFETWLLDLGAVAGGLLGTALVLGIPAPNPVLGYGGIGLGVVLGASAGVAVGKLVPLGLELVELPNLVAMGPLVLPPGRTGEVPIGAQVTLDLDALLR